MLATISVAVAQAADLNLGALTHPAMSRLYVEEILELVAGLMLLLYALHFARRGRAAEAKAALRRA